MLHPSVKARIMDILLHQNGEKDSEIRAASLPTLNDNDLVSSAALFWVQAGWIWAFVVSGWSWLLAFSLLDVLLFATRWQMRRGRDLLGRPIDATSDVLSMAINVGLMAIVSICIFVLTQTGSDRSCILAIILAVGFSGYATALYAAFAVLASLNIGLLYGALGIGLAIGSSDLVRPFALLTPCATLAFWLLTQQTHLTLLSAIRSQRDNQRLAMQDPLTKLPNRCSMRDALSRHVASIGTATGPEGVAVLCLDLDGFKAINDRHGHAAGDWVLVHVADILRRCIAVGDSACRTGGDEYVVLLPGADEARAVAVGASIIESVLKPLAIGQIIPARVGVSIGAVVARNPSNAVDAVLEVADRALYAAKRGGRGQLRFASELVATSIETAA